MHTIHHTDAVVIKSMPAGEANKRVWLFTREFGLVVALVQGVRKPEAKLQSQIVDYSFIKADLVKGKEVWRLVSAENIDNPLVGRTRSPLARTYVRTLSAMDRFLIGEGPHEEIYAHIEQAAALLGSDVPPKAYDTLSLWKLLAYLGYIAGEPEDEQFLNASFEEALTFLNDSAIARLSAAAVHAIKESHL